MIKVLIINKQNLTRLVSQFCTAAAGKASSTSSQNHQPKTTVLDRWVSLEIQVLCASPANLFKESREERVPRTLFSNINKTTTTTVSDRWVSLATYVVSAPPANLFKKGREGRVPRALPSNTKLRSLRASKIP